MTIDRTTINGRVVWVIERHQMTTGMEDCIDHLTIEGLHEEWLIGSEITVAFPTERFHGRITAVIPNDLKTELRIVHGGSSEPIARRAR